METSRQKLYGILRTTSVCVCVCLRTYVWDMELFAVNVGE